MMVYVTCMGEQGEAGFQTLHTTCASIMSTDDTLTRTLNLCTNATFPNRTL